MTSWNARRIREKEGDFGDSVPGIERWTALKRESHGLLTTGPPPMPQARNRDHLATKK